LGSSSAAQCFYCLYWFLDPDCAEYGKCSPYPPWDPHCEE
jgi:hypothetical protein